jgi:DNA-binding MarR family transcriptional regulator
MFPVARQRAEDRRSIVIPLTDDGRPLLPQLAPAFGGGVVGTLGPLASEDATSLEAILQRLVDAWGDR